MCWNLYRNMVSRPMLDHSWAPSKITILLWLRGMCSFEQKMKNHEKSMNFKEHKSIRMVGRALGGRIPLFLFSWNLEKLLFPQSAKRGPKTRNNCECSCHLLKSDFGRVPSFLGVPRNPVTWGKVEEKWPKNEDTSVQEWCIFKRLQKGPPGVL